MKNKYLLLIIPLLSLLWACEKETENVSQLKKLPNITLKGNETVYIKASKLVSTWEEIGYKEEGATSDVGEVQIMNGIPENNIKPGVYYVKYVTVGDGVIETESTRKVIIYEDDGIMSGIYTAETDGWGGAYNEKATEVVISTLSDDGAGNKVYTCNDLYASHFSYARGGQFNWIVAKSKDMKIDAAGNITASSGMLTTSLLVGKKNDAEHIEWETKSGDYSFIKVKVKLTKKKF